MTQSLWYKRKTHSLGVVISCLPCSEYDLLTGGGGDTQIKLWSVFAAKAEQVQSPATTGSGDTSRIVATQPRASVVDVQAVIKRDQPMQQVLFAPVGQVCFIARTQHLVCTYPNLSIGKPLWRLSYQCVLQWSASRVAGACCYRCVATTSILDR